MGAAKNRKVEIAALKAAPKQMVKVFAVRNAKNGGTEFVKFGFVPVAAINSKSALLRSVACSVWGHTAPCVQIAEYLTLTDSYAMMSKLQKPVGYFIEFFEDDADRPGMYSCRTVCGIRTDEQFDAFVDSKVAEMDLTDDEIRRY